MMRLALVVAVAALLPRPRRPRYPISIASRSGAPSTTAVSAADLADLYGQVQGVIGRGAEYVTVLMGANDVCASSQAGSLGRRKARRRDVERRGGFLG